MRFAISTAAKIKVHGGADPFGALDGSETAEPARQFPGRGDGRSGGPDRIEDFREAIGREAWPIVLDGEPQIIARDASRKLGSVCTADCEFSGPDRQLSAFRHVGCRLGEEQADQ